MSARAPMNLFIMFFITGNIHYFLEIPVVFIILGIWRRGLVYLADKRGGLRIRWS